MQNLIQNVSKMFEQMFLNLKALKRKAADSQEQSLANKSYPSSKTNICPISRICLRILEKVKHIP